MTCLMRMSMSTRPARTTRGSAFQWAKGLMKPRATSLSFYKFQCTCIYHHLLLCPHTISLCRLQQHLTAVFGACVVNEDDTLTITSETKTATYRPSSNVSWMRPCRANSCECRAAMTHVTYTGVILGGWGVPSFSAGSNIAVTRHAVPISIIPFDMWSLDGSSIRNCITARCIMVESSVRIAINQVKLWMNENIGLITVSTLIWFVIENSRLSTSYNPLDYDKIMNDHWTLARQAVMCY